MLLSSFASLRRLTLLAVLVFVAAAIFLQTTEYSNYLPKLHIPGSFSQGNVRYHNIGDDVQDSTGVAFSRPRTEIRSHVTVTIAAHWWSGLDAGTLVTPVDGPWTSQTSTQVRTASATALPLSLGPYEQTQVQIKELVDSWVPPDDPEHWPPYLDYVGKGYDPNRWEGFPWNHDYYINNGIEKLKDNASVTLDTYLPYPEYNADAWKKQWQGQYVPCESARGRLLNQSVEDFVKAYSKTPAGFPSAIAGDGNVADIDTARCFDRYNRYGPYGFGQVQREPVSDWQRPISRPDWSAVPWGDLQDKCLLANKDRYAPTARQPVELAPDKDMPKEDKNHRIAYEKANTRRKRFHARSAVLIRVWEGYEYNENDLHVIRAMITELSLLSGGEYQVFLFLNVKDKNADIFSNQTLRDEVLRANVPRELHNITILWTERVCEEWYPKVGDWQVYWHQFMPLQWFSKTHPEFDFVWNWEIDARYTGNHYQFLQSVSDFSSQMPRKHLWERNQRVYFPSVHGTYEQFLNNTDLAIESANSESAFEPVWGPRPYAPNSQKPLGPSPPHSHKADHFVWGVGEPADLITLHPIWDPNNTEWSFKDKIWNYVPGLRPSFTQDDPIDEHFQNTEFGNIPRRVYINTLSRFSQRQLHAMHVENMNGRTMATEMWPATVALQHGLKAVYAPHPVWTDHMWPDWYLDAVFNADGNRSVQWSQQADSVYNHDREHNFGGWSWYYDSTFARSLYRRWLGWAVDDASPLSGLGGKSWEDAGVVAQLEVGEDAVVIGGSGRMCLPAMLLHPVKNVREDENTELVEDEAPS